MTCMYVVSRYYNLKYTRSMHTHNLIFNEEKILLFINFSWNLPSMHIIQESLLYTIQQTNNKMSHIKFLIGILLLFSERQR